MKAILRRPTHYSIISFVRCFFEPESSYSDSIHAFFRRNPSITELLDSPFRLLNSFNASRQKRIRIDYWDSWSVDSTLSSIILGLLQQLRKTGHGYGLISNNESDGPPELFSEKDDEKDDNNDQQRRRRYEWVLDEMIWSFNELANGSDYIERLYLSTRPYSEENEKKNNPFDGLHSINRGKPKSEWQKIVYDWDAIKLHEERIVRGTTLFGKYFQTLWD